MPDNTILDLLERNDPGQGNERIGSTARRNIDKTGYCYHTITKAWGNDNIYSLEVARYRQELLCKLCKEKHIAILFSVTMPNHTHEVFITPDWETLAQTIRLLNTQVSRYIKKDKKARGRKVTEGMKVFTAYPTYIIVKDICYLFFLGKYIFDNPGHLKKEGKVVPDSCFWMFEKGYFKEPYDKALYKKLFDLEPSEILNHYQTKTKEEIFAFAKVQFRNWTEDDNRRMFINEERINQ